MNPECVRHGLHSADSFRETDSMRALASSNPNKEHEAAAEISFWLAAAWLVGKSGSPPTCTAQITGGDGLGEIRDTATKGSFGVRGVGVCECECECE